jgi:hypothetical protein
MSEQVYLITTRIRSLEQEREQAYLDYVDKVTAINREIERLQNEISNKEIMI